MSTLDEIARMSALELTERFRRKDLSPVEATEAALRQIERFDGELNGFCLVDADRALADARESEARYQRGEPAGLVDGVPTGVKDVFLTRGWPTLRGSLLTEAEQPWEIDAPVPAALRRNGAVFVGKTTTPELGWKGVTDSPRHGVTRNPWNPAVTSGGSSGGSGVAVATGMSALATGTDGGGSIRIPASFCGVSGIKPTFGRVPHWPVSPYGTLAHAGPMARTVADVALMLRVLAEPDARDWQALPPEDTDYVAALEGGIAGLRVAFSPDLGFATVDDEVAAAVAAAAKAFADLGAEVEEASPGFDDPIDIYSILWDSGAAAATQMYTDEQRERMDPGLEEITAEASALSALDYLDAATRRGLLGVEMSLFHERYDLLLTPAMPIPPFSAGQEVPDGWRYRREGWTPYTYPFNLTHQPEWLHRRWAGWSPFTYPFNLTQQPAASVPCGFTRDGLPIGLQIVGARHADALVLRAAHTFQQATDHLKWPPLVEEERP